MIRALAIVACLVAPAAAFAQDGADLLKQLNGTLEKVSPSKASWKSVLEAWSEATPPPCSAESGCGQDAIWPGMKEWAKFASWAESNPQLARALLAAQAMDGWNMPYGADLVPARLREKGVSVTVGSGNHLSNVVVGYLPAVRTIGLYAVAEQYRLCEAGRFQQGFELGLAYLRLLRQVCDQSLLTEKLFGMEQLTQALSVQRDMLWRYRQSLPPRLASSLAKDGYTLLAKGDAETLRRLKMPEADILVMRAQLALGFDSSGTPLPGKFAQAFGADPAHPSPMQRFGEEKLWSRLAAVHASLQDSEQKLQAVYDDWYRRWRMRPYGSPYESVPTRLSTMNPVRYAAVDAQIRDIRSVFDARKLLIANLNGTAYAASLVAYFRNEGNWPNTEEKAVSGAYMRARFNLDPYNKDFDPNRQPGKGFGFSFAPSDRLLDTTAGRLSVKGPIVFSLGADLVSEGAKQNTDDGSKGDILIWPPVRELAREQGLLGS
jgi:hypothetical protein